jgi:DNA polymerase III subunit delta'
VAKKSASRKAPRKKTAPGRRAPAARASAEREPSPEAELARAVLRTPLDGVLGQEHAVGLLDAAVGADRLHHAWLFHGPEGVGKFTTAMAFAAVVLDPTAAPDLSARVRPDPDSQVQRLLRAGSHPDLHVVRKELAGFSRDDATRRSKQTGIAIEVVREFLIEPASRTRVCQGDSRASKVFIIDQAELLGREAEHALLKTLEEPGQGVVIVLVTASEDRLLPTIRSRCQRVAFRPLAPEAMRAWIERAGLDQAGIDMEWALACAAGSPGVLAELIEGGLGAWQPRLRPIVESLARGRSVLGAGATLKQLVDEAAAAAVQGKPHASKTVANREAAGRMFRLLGEGFRGSLRAAASVGRTEEAEHLARCIATCEEAERLLGANVQLGPAFEWLAASCGAER